MIDLTVSNVPSTWFLSGARRLLLGLGLASIPVSAGAIQVLQEHRSPEEIPPLPQRYRIQGIGTLGGAESYVRDFSEDGSVVGFSSNRDGVDMAFLLVPEVSEDGLTYFLDNDNDGANDLMRALPPLSPDSSGLLFGSATGVNNDEVVVGSSSADPMRNAVLWQHGVTLDLGPHLGMDGYGTATDISDSGLIVGFEFEPDGRLGHVIVPRNYEPDGLGTVWFEDADQDGENDLAYELGGSYIPTDINDAGRITLNSGGRKSRAHIAMPDWEDSDGDGNPYFADRNGDGRNDQILDLPTREGKTSKAEAVNNLGQVAGQVGDRPVLWEQNQGVWTLRELGSIEGETDVTACDLNDFGRVVGYAPSFPSGGNQIFNGYLWFEGEMHNVLKMVENRGQWSTLEVRRINDQDVMAGNGSVIGRNEGFVAIPVR